MHLTIKVKFAKIYKKSACFFAKYGHVTWRCLQVLWHKPAKTEWKPTKIYRNPQQWRKKIMLKKSISETTKNHFKSTVLKIRKKPPQTAKYNKRSSLLCGFSAALATLVYASAHPGQQLRGIRNIDWVWKCVIKPLQKQSHGQ